MATTKEVMRNRMLQADPNPLAIHELGVMGSSQTAQSMRMREMHAEGLVEGRVRKGEAFKEWRLTEPGKTLAASEKHIFDDAREAAARVA